VTTGTLVCHKQGSATRVGAQSLGLLLGLSGGDQNRLRVLCARTGGAGGAWLIVWVSRRDGLEVHLGVRLLRA